MHTTPPRRRFLTPVRSAVLLLSLVAAAVTYPAQAQTEGSAEVQKTAYWSSPVTNALPPTLTNGFPPGVACLLAGIAQIPQVCGEQVQQLKATIGLTGGVPLPSSPDSEPAFPQPVAPDTLPVGLLGGQERYTSFLKFKLPQVPFGETVDRFTLELEQAAAPNFALESLAVRQASKAALAQVGARSPDPFVELFNAIVNDPSVVAQTNPTGIEACPVLADWTAGKHDSSDPADQKPPVDCIFGSNGRFDDDTGTWSWDLTFAMQGWLDGTLPNFGIVLRPLGAENLAYGDPDLSTNWMVSLSVASDDPPEYVLGSSPEPEGTPFVGSGSVGGSSLGSPLVNSDPFQTSVAPVPGQPGTVRPPQEQPQRQLGVVQNTASGDAEFPWWLWLLVPLALYGHYLLGTATMATPAMAASRPGALTALVDRASGSSR